MNRIFSQRSWSARFTRTVRLSTTATLAVLALAVVTQSWVASAAVVAPGGTPGWQPHTVVGPTDFDQGHPPYFAGYHKKTSGPITIESTMPVVGTGSCEVNSLVAGSVFMLDDAYNATAAYVTSECYAGGPHYSLWLIAPDGTYIHRTTGVLLGDIFKVTVTVTPDGTHLEAANLTQGWTSTFDGPSLEVSRVAVGAVTGHNAAGSRIPIPEFGKMRFDDTFVNGDVLQSIQPKPLDLMKNSGPRMTTGHIHFGTDFTVTFRSK